MSVPRHVALWDSINRFALAKGGDPAKVSVEIMQAVVLVNHELEKLGLAPRTPPQANQVDFNRDRIDAILALYRDQAPGTIGHTLYWAVTEIETLRYNLDLERMARYGREMEAVEDADDARREKDVALEQYGQLRKLANEVTLSCPASGEYDDEEERAAGENAMDALRTFLKVSR